MQYIGSKAKGIAHKHYFLLIKLCPVQIRVKVLKPLHSQFHYPGLNNELHTWQVVRDTFLIVGMGGSRQARGEC